MKTHLTRPFVWLSLCLLLLGGCNAQPTKESSSSETISFPGLDSGRRSDASPSDSSSSPDDASPPEPLVELLADHGHHSDSTSRNCSPSECNQAPAGLCVDGKRLQEFIAPGSCHPTEDRCVFKIREKTCPERCEQGRCVKASESCVSKVCSTPPASTCVNASTLKVFSKTGFCDKGVCNYNSSQQPCAHGCQKGSCLPDPCTSQKCTTPPQSTCTNSTTLRLYQKQGHCKQGKCSYSSTEQKCPYGCKSGACVVGSGFSALTPFRFLDTRGGSRPGSGSTTCFAIAGKGGVPANARAVYLNLVAVNPSAPGFLTVYPQGKSRPNASSLNYTKGETIANGSIVALGSGGQICVYAAASTDLILDVSGYFGTRSDYFPLSPVRALDTRSGSTIGDQSTRCVKVAGRLGVPSSAIAVFVNIAAVSASAIGHLIVYSKGASRPATSTLNYVQGQTIANGALVKPGTGGEICIYAHMATHVVVDIGGYFGTQSNFVSKQPQRLLDTRQTSILGAQKTTCFAIAGTKGIPANAGAVALNLTIVAPLDNGFATAYTEGTSRPVTSSLNYVKGRTQANNLLVRPGKSGKLCVYTFASAHVIVDAVGYFSAIPTATSCTGVTCTTPPPAVCTGGNSILSYNSKGQCQNGLCVYPLSSKTCQWGCEKAKCKPQPPAPKYTFHPVTSWQLSSQRVSSSARMDLKALRYITIHYPGGTLDLDGKDNVYQDSDFAQILRNMQSDYVRNRGYSLGYNSAVAPDGDEWEIRGSTYRCAANGCTKVNTPGYAIIVVTPAVAASPSSAQVKGVLQAIARVRALAKAAGNPHKLVINGHRDVKPLCGKGGTACPGTPLYNLIKNGTFK